MPDDFAGASVASPFTNNLLNASAKLHLLWLPLFYLTETSQHSIVICVNNGHKMAFPPSAAACLQNIKECIVRRPSKLPSQTHLNNVFPSYMQNSDEYLQHPGIGITGRKKKKKRHTTNPPQPCKCNHSQKCSPNKLYWVLLPSNNPTAAFCPGTGKVGRSILSARSVYSPNGSRDGKRDVTRVKVGVRSAGGRDPEIDMKHYL